LNFDEFSPAFTIVNRMQEQTFSLQDMKNGETATVVALSSQKQATQKLHQLGIRVGVDVQVLRRAPLNGPLLVKVSGREIAIGYGLCAKILVGVDH